MEQPVVPPSAIITQAPAVHFGTRDVVPPSPLYVTSDDVLFIQTINTFTGIVLTISGRLLRADGQIIPMERRVSPLSNLTLENFTIALTEGFLLSLSVSSNAGGGITGSTYVHASIAKKTAPAQSPSFILFSDYLHFTLPTGWPGGKQISPLDGPGELRTIQGTNPAAGAEISETVPNGARWQFLGMRTTFVTSATVASRIPHLIFDDGAAIYFETEAQSAQAASLTRIHCAAAGFVKASSNDNVNMWSFNVQPTLHSAHRFRTLTSNLQVGDDWAAPVFQVREWFTLS